MDVISTSQMRVVIVRSSGLNDMSVEGVILKSYIQYKNPTQKRVVIRQSLLGGFDVCFFLLLLFFNP